MFPAAFDPKRAKTCALIHNSFPLPSIALGSSHHYFNDSLHKWLRAFILKCSWELIWVTPTEHIVWTCNYFLWMLCESVEIKHEHFQANCNFCSGPLQHPKLWKQGVLIVVPSTKTVDAQFAEPKVSNYHIYDFNVQTTSHKQYLITTPLSPLLFPHNCYKRTSTTRARQKGLPTVC